MPKSITDRIRAEIHTGAMVPKPSAPESYRIKGWGRRRGEQALVYFIPSRGNPNYPHEKGITETEFELAWQHLLQAGEITRRWFNGKLPACAREGSCNFTTIGGIFELLGEASYSSRGTYRRTSGKTGNR
ncbi:MAG: hypothetical protein OXI88_12490 [Gammaproteobacteria bacterium]|nr:hypothetical protein [Gammaproteobacteria bacterium]